MGIDSPPLPDLEYEGFTTPGLPDDVLLRSIEEYLDHHVLLLDGGFLDQPPEWWADVRQYEIMYNVAYGEEKALEEQHDRR